MDTVEASLRRRGIPKWALPVFGYGISAISLVWVFSKFPFVQLGQQLRTIHWSWVALAILAEVLVYFAEAWRWAVLLKPAGAPPFLSCLQAVFVGLLYNDILPARTGEVVRCFLLSYKTNIHLPLTLTSDLIERIMDGVWIVLIYLAVTPFVTRHPDVDYVMWIFGSVVVVIAAILLWMLFHRQGAHHFLNSRSWGRRVIHVLDEIHALGHWRELGLAFLIGGLYWALQAVAIWALAKADDFDFGVASVTFILVVRTVYTVIPSAPASMGTYQFAIVHALRLLLTERANSQIFAEIAFSILTLPLLVGGAVALASAGFSLKNLHLHAHSAHAKRHHKKES